MAKRKNKAYHRVTNNFTFDPFILKWVRGHAQTTGVPASKSIEFALLDYYPALKSAFNKELKRRSTNA